MIVNDKMDVTLAIAIIGCVISVSSFALNRKDKSSKESGDSNYRQGQLDMQIKQILAKLEKIDKKLDTYDREIEERIKIAIENHIAIYHKGE